MWIFDAGRNVPNKCWPLALQTAAYIKNRTIYEALGEILPIEVGTGETRKPDRLCTFGCTAYVQIEKGLRDGKGGRSGGMVSSLFFCWKLELERFMLLDLFNDPNCALNKGCKNLCHAVANTLKTKAITGQAAHLIKTRNCCRWT